MPNHVLKLEDTALATKPSRVTAGHLRRESGRSTMRRRTAATDLERELLAFDPEEDVAAVIPMPLAIPGDVRLAFTRAVLERFTDAVELDEWLHAPHLALDGATPFERVVAGYQMDDVLALLKLERVSRGQVATGTSLRAQRRTLRLVG